MSIPCVGAVVVDASGRLLLVRRANPPHAGLWSLPGGHVEPGETREQAVVREVAEETGLQVLVLRRVGRVGIGDYDVVDFSCEIIGGSLAAGSDAADAAVADPRDLDCTPGLVETLVGWRVLPRRPTRSRSSARRTVVGGVLVILAALPLIPLTVAASMAADGCSPGEQGLACGSAGARLPAVTLAVGIAAPLLAALGALVRRRPGRALVVVAAGVTAVTWAGALVVLSSGG